MPAELSTALWVESLARRYNCTPSQVLREPAWLLRHLRILEEGGVE